ncbi:MAG: MATE family efflux transporter [Rhodobacteraceae bacterium]|nr:MATE family efflux transporter [Paracoccaceae bacterium]
MTHTADLTVGSIPGHFRRMAIPTAIGMVFTTLYNVVDSYFAGIISTDALAALAVSFHVFFILVTFGFGVNSAMGALVGNALGAGRRRYARTIACQGISYAVVASILLTVVGYAVSPFLISAVSEPGSFRDLANAYIDVLLLAAPAFIVVFSINGILGAQGDAVSMQRAQIAAFFANIALNPIMIFGIPGVFPALGFNGIALSTATSQSGVLAYMLWRLYRSELMARQRLVLYRPRLRQFREITVLALPASSAMIVMLVGAFVVQLYLKQFGPQAIAAYGVGLRIEQMLLLPAFGLTITLLPIAAQNFGAHEYERVQEAFIFCCKAGTLLMLLASLLLWVASKPAMSLFTDDPEVIRIGRNYLNVDGFMLPIYILLFAMNSLLQALKRPMFTLWIGIFRQGFGIAFFCAIFVLVFDWGTWGVWLGVAASVATGLLLAFWFTLRVARKEIGGIFRQSRENPND